MPPSFTLTIPQWYIAISLCYCAVGCFGAWQRTNHAYRFHGATWHTYPHQFLAVALGMIVWPLAIVCDVLAARVGVRPQPAKANADRTAEERLSDMRAAALPVVTESAKRYLWAEVVRVRLSKGATATSAVPEAERACECLAHELAENDQLSPHEWSMFYVQTFDAAEATRLCGLLRQRFPALEATRMIGAR